MLKRAFSGMTQMFKMVGLSVGFSFDMKPDRFMTLRAEGFFHFSQLPHLL
jgi:hypothetical protein